MKEQIVFLIVGSIIPVAILHARNGYPRRLRGWISQNKSAERHLKEQTKPIGPKILSVITS